MEPLRILSLGTPAVFIDEKPVQIQRRIQRAMLFYLANQADMVSRSELLALFWPEEEEEVARRHLREALSKLRSDLREAFSKEASDQPEPDLLVTTPDKAGLNFELVYSDALEFQRLVDQAGSVPWNRPSNRPLPEAVYQVLLKAIRLWRTPRFLAGINLPSSIELEMWLTLASQNLERQRGQVIERLADHAVAAGDLEAALNWLHRALESDETNEDLHLRVLKTLVTLGRRSEAIKYYTYVQDLIRRELGAPPSVALQSLY
ncbi:MAG TPA: BTAD domain-containing putative transcriptional regulator, partial [Anaerolineaceae bacterium]|nr:BTAD domain-containing putative transcriptional regulator [Anaerolineaceae bacterium]